MELFQALHIFSQIRLFPDAAADLWWEPVLKDLRKDNVRTTQNTTFDKNH